MYNMLSFAAGVMLSISFLDLIPESINLSGIGYCIAGVLAGVIVIASLDRLLPHIHPGMCSPEREENNLAKTATYLLAGIFIHNFPEGMAIGVGSAIDLKVSMTIALAIAIHNIPEGICTVAPYYYVTKDRLKSFLVSSSTAIPIVLGFMVTHYLAQNIPLEFIGFLMAGTAGLMIYISADELIPTSCCKQTDHTTIYSLIAGVLLVIGLGLL